MSDGEDDFMCEEEEDYGLVSFPSRFKRISVLMIIFPARGEVRILEAVYVTFKNSPGDALCKDFFHDKLYSLLKIFDYILCKYIRSFVYLG